MTMTVQDIPRGWKAKAGTFSKGIEAAEAFNFSESAGPNCSTACQQLIDGKCYAENLEKHRSNIALSGERKRVQGVIQTCMDYISELTRLRDDVIPWIRISSFGSVPNSLTPAQAAVFTEFLKESARVGERVHFPVETENKRSLYQSLVDEAGLDTVVRVSLQKLSLFEKYYNSETPFSLVWKHGKTLSQRIANAQEFAKAHDRVIVCPSIQTKANKGKAAKCGNCTACSDKNMVIIYPEH